MDIATAQRCYARYQASGRVCAGCSWQYHCGMFNRNAVPVGYRKGDIVQGVCGCLAVVNYAFSDGAIKVHTIQGCANGAFDVYVIGNPIDWVGTHWQKGHSTHTVMEKVIAKLSEGKDND